MPKKYKYVLYGALGVIAIIIVMAVYSLNKTYTVIFNARGGTSIAFAQVKNGEKLEQPVDPELEGFIFLGWFLDGEPYDFSKPVVKDITLDAEWQAK